MSRLKLPLIVAAFLLAGCNSKSGGSESVGLKVRFARSAATVSGVTDQGNRFQTAAPAGSRYAVVGASVTFDRCADSLDPKLAEAMGSAGKGMAVVNQADFALVFPDGKRYKPDGNGERDQVKCMACDNMLMAPCVGEKSKSFLPVVVFTVPQGSDPASAALEYRGSKASLAGAPNE